MNNFTIFYCWENNIPKQKNIIEKIIKKSIKDLKKEDSTTIIELDRDTKNKIGAVDIVNTIFHKINESDLFIADVSFVNINKTPNPNVLIELGYAINHLGNERIILLFNSAKGKPEKLPFDINKMRVLSFNLKRIEQFEIELKHAIKSIYQIGKYEYIYPDWVIHDSKIFKNLISSFPDRLDLFFNELLTKRYYKSEDLYFLRNFDYDIKNPEFYIINPKLRDTIIRFNESLIEMDIKLSLLVTPPELHSKKYTFKAPQNGDIEVCNRFYKDLDELQTLCNIASINYIEMRNTATQIFGEIN